MKILLVGPGAVGQVFAWHLKNSGSRIGFFVREEHASWASKPLVLFPMNGLLNQKRVLNDHVLRFRPEELEDEEWDQIWLCVSSPALRKGTWLEALVASAGNAVIVTFQPGLTDRQWLEERISPNRLVSGLIPFAAWFSDTQGAVDNSEKGVHYWLPPFTAVSFQGQRAKRVVDALKSSRLRAKIVDDVLSKTAYGSSVLLSFMAGLETAGWSFQAYRQSDVNRLVHKAALQGIAVSSAYHQISLPFFRYFLTPWVLLFATRVAPLFFPVNLERYLCTHFTKVGEQTLVALTNLIAEGGKRSLPVESIVNLKARLLQTKSAR